MTFIMTFIMNNTHKSSIIEMNQAIQQSVHDKNEKRLKTITTK